MAEEPDERLAFEAVGRLAGGVAHDLNNLLTVIQGFARRALTRAGDESRGDLEEIVGAAERAAALVEHLLTLGREAGPTAVDLDTLVRMLAAGAGVGPGDVVRTTVDLDRDDALARDLLPGRYRVLTVPADGEPRAVLGVLVAEAGGRLESLPGELRVYLPAGMEQRPLSILIAEDEGPLRRLLRTLLEDEGHAVLEASDGSEALKLVQAEGREIDLLLTDVVMPDVSGTELAASLLTLFPRLQVIYMSGYTDGALPEPDAEDPPVQLLRKPFTGDALVATIDRLTFD